MHENSWGQSDWRDFKVGSAAKRVDYGDGSWGLLLVQVIALFASAQSVAHRLASSSASTGWYQSGLFTCVLSR